MVEEALVDAPEPRQSPKQWRRLGLLVAVVGTVGAMVGMTWPQKHLSPMQRMSKMTKTFMTAFAARKLTDVERNYAVDINWKFVENDAPLEGMTIEAELQHAENAVDPGISIVFAALEGKGEELGNQLELVKAELLNVSELLDYSDYIQNITVVAHDDDTVAVHYGSPPLDEDAAQTIAEGLEEQTPELGFRIALGRTFAEMYENLASDPLPLLPAGVSLSFHTSVARKVLSGMEALAGAGDTLNTPMEQLALFSSVSSNTSLKYRREESAKELAKLFFTPMDAWSKDIIDSHMTWLHGLRGCSDGVQTIKVRGMGYKVVARFTHFRVSAVLAAIEDAE